MHDFFYPYTENVLNVLVCVFHSRSLEYGAFLPLGICPDSEILVRDR